MTSSLMFRPILVILLIMLLFQALGMELFRLEPRLLSQHEWWRLWTGHWVHANWQHLALNAGGLVLCVYLTNVQWNTWQWGWRILLLSSMISLCFYLWHPNLGWYVGFSGVLFGLYILCAIASLSRQLVMSAVLIGLIIGKILLEQFTSLDINSGDMIGVPVLVDAHLYGVISAGVLVLIQKSHEQLKIYFS